MNIKKSMLVVGVASTVAIASVAGVSAATSSSTDAQDGLVNKIAKKFNLKPADVKSVFAEDRAAHDADRQKAMQAELDQLVKDGKINSTQEAAIIAKQAELKKEMEANRSTMQDKTPTERKALMDQKKADLEKWASDNGISTDILKQVLGHGPGGHMGHGGMGGPGAPDADDQTTGATQTQ